MTIYDEIKPGAPLPLTGNRQQNRRMKRIQEELEAKIRAACKTSPMTESAYHEGCKTQTRRVAFVADALREFSCASYPDGWWYEGRVYKSFKSFVHDRQTPKCKYSPGDILWVRETWGKLTECNVYPPYEPEEERFIYRADIGDPDHFQAKWHPSIYMPKEAARIFLRVKDVRVERLQNIKNYECVDEGAVKKPNITKRGDKADIFVTVKPDGGIRLQANVYPFHMLVQPFSKVGLQRCKEFVRRWAG